MPYFGLKVELEKVDVTIKLHGPLDTFVINTQELRSVIFLSAGKYFENGDNIPGFTIFLADTIKDKYLNGNDLVWVGVEINIKSNGVIFGASAEKVLVS
jgi:hypothetical protein